MITLDIHSSLEAVGFIARIANVLALHDMGVNPVSAFYHDHLFVPEKRADVRCVFWRKSRGTIEVRFSAILQFSSFLRGFTLAFSQMHLISFLQVVANSES